MTQLPVHQMTQVPPLTPLPRRDRSAVVRDASGAALWLTLLFVCALWVHDGGVSDLAAWGTGMTSLGRIFGLLGSALLLAQVFLMARVPWVERAWGQDHLARIHRVVGFTSFNLIVAHIVLIWLGYASTGPQGLWGTLVEFTLNYPGMLLAIAGTLALIMVVLTSVRAARRRLRYESWHLLHLYAYLAAGLALPHQLWTGKEFLSSPVSTIFWWGLYAGCAAAVLVYRVALPATRALRHQARVVDVRHESPSIVSVTVAGPRLGRLPVRGGQFLQWRFLDGPGWTRSHPYSLSAAPDGRTLRLTAAVVGDGTDRLRGLRPGTRVLIEGPYGRLHEGVRTQRKVLLIGAGVGITPLRALLEALPAAPGDITVVQRSRSSDERVLGAEIADLASRRGARYVVVEGNRIRGRRSWLSESASAWSDEAALLDICPDLVEHDIFICGTPPWMDAVRAAARSAGVPAAQIHTERFDY
ncbi:ferric reductase-like transmembrane domain-containing protein [Allobranchiibius sp. CTAmp26]|uniref:ferredoxin reductase family protein n=1 Tax=Allobranchiibius sp. CTAmp26 TaxID=2815214 RepID=UPI001AA15257|nr:ferric reductase-like transmembrane domain-containing protein [Allobranchiibius sp. CTAmp26]MBO1754868.1 ferredoxin reductase family protein [Allobranchiibius sp. CTAmp26]